MLQISPPWRLFALCAEASIGSEAEVVHMASQIALLVRGNWTLRSEVYYEVTPDDGLLIEAPLLISPLTHRCSLWVSVSWRVAMLWCKRSQSHESYVVKSWNELTTE